MATSKNSPAKKPGRPRKSPAEAAQEAKVAAETAKNQAVRARAAAAKITTGQAAGFINFVREQGVVGLAVGLAIGTAAGASVKVIVEQFITPLVALATRGVDLANLKVVIIAASDGQKEVAIGYGLIIASLITLLATALVVYLAVHALKLDRLDKKKDS